MATESEHRVRSSGREVAVFVAGTVTLLIGVAAAFIGGLLVPFVVSYVVTPAITGWEDPGPEIIQGCETSVMCSEPGTFMTIWASAFTCYVVVAVLAIRWALNKVAPQRPALG